MSFGFVVPPVAERSPRTAADGFGVVSGSVIDAPTVFVRASVVPAAGGSVGSSEDGCFEVVG